MREATDVKQNDHYNSARQSECFLKLKTVIQRFVAAMSKFDFKAMSMFFSSTIKTFCSLHCQGVLVAHFIIVSAQRVVVILQRILQIYA